jgi:tetratricopeptide (TPR) repeat protein
MPPRATARAALAALALAAIVSAPSASAAPPAAAKGDDTPAAREQARLCERLDGKDALAACRQALALGIALPRRAAVRQLLARRLAALERWEDLAELLRESVRLDPADPEVWARLGAVLLYGLERPVEAVAALDQAARLAPDAAPPRVDLAVALASAGRLGESAAAFDAAEALDPAVLDSRPAARAVRDAARAGRRWPQ